MLLEHLQFILELSFSNMNDSNWTDTYNLQGSRAPIIWDAPTGAEPDVTRLVEGGDGITFTGDITIRVQE